jgi:hypothetical protein
MTKLTNTALKPGNGKPNAKEMAIVKTILNPAENKIEEKKPGLQIEPEKPVIPAPEPKKEMTMMEKILKIENLQLVIEKRAKLVQTRSVLDRFQISSNDFNCTMRLNDSDGNVFTTSFTPGIKKVIDFLNPRSMQASRRLKTISPSESFPSSRFRRTGLWPVRIFYGRKDL